MKDWYTLHLVFRTRLYNKTNSNQRRWDVSNHLKLIEDALCEAVSIDDRQIIRLIAEKEEGPSGFTATLEVFSGEGKKQGPKA